jgi:demethylmenaquinone methyltransferase/2-methoxy-6-polyprenyl-1,4-benzoquinol methylase
MGNEFYQPGEQRGVKVRQLFSQIAGRYDLINDLQSLGLHRYWKSRLLHAARVRPGERVLDLCCGTGDLCLGLVRRRAKVVGIDFSQAMLLRARDRVVAEEGLPVSFLRGDALNLPFEDQSFDLVTVSYGLRNLADLEGGLREIHRVIHPGGRFLALDFGKPDNRLWRRLYFGYLQCCVPFFGWAFFRNPEAYAYILESLRHYPAQHGVAESLRALQFTGLEILNLMGGAMCIHYAEKPAVHRAKAVDAD